MEQHATHLQDVTVFDRNELLFRLGGAADIVGRILSLSVKSLSEHMPKLADGVSGGDAECIRYHAHTISGVAANVGAGTIHSIAAKMEALAKAGSLAEMSGLMATLEEGFVGFKVCVDALQEQQ